MKRKELFSICLGIFVFLLLFSEIVHSQTDRLLSQDSIAESVPQIAFSTPFLVQIYVNYNQTSNYIQSTRLEILTHIKKNPGTHFRGICNLLSLPIGVVQYHLRRLKKEGLVKSYSDKRYKRYFESGVFKESEMKLISLLRHKTAGKILTVLDKTNLISHKTLALKLGLSSQALSWQMSQLEEIGIVETLRSNTNVKYFITKNTASLLKRCMPLADLM